MTPPPSILQDPRHLPQGAGGLFVPQGKKGPGLPGGGEAGAFAHALVGAARRSQAAVEEATSEEAASEEAASLETSEAASEDAASEVEAAVEEELPQAVMLTARTRAATVTATFLSFISKISLLLKKQFRGRLYR